MHHIVKQNANQPTIKIIPIIETDFSNWFEGENAEVKAWVAQNKFAAKPGSICVVPDYSKPGQIAKVLFGINLLESFHFFGALPLQLPEGYYSYATEQFSLQQLEHAVLGWGLGAYRFNCYKHFPELKARLVAPDTINFAHVENLIKAIYLVRDLINMPSEDMGPADLYTVAENLAETHSGKVQQWVGEELLDANYPAIYAVGKGGARPPRLIDLTWGDPNHPKVTLVGKGVCFDSGGLDLKNPQGMRFMKKDMGGAAHVLGLARLIMTENLPIRLRVLIPAVENMVSGTSYKPGDVIKTRKGITVEIDNTDAEGRLILADALTEAVAEKPDLLIDFATLTGAARVALGTELGGLFSNRPELASQICDCAVDVNDPVWPMPLYKPYRDLLNSSIADISNASTSPYGGAITAALFLQEFIEPGIEWMHLDIMAWNLQSKPGRPEGGEAAGLRAVYHYLLQRYK